MKKIFLGMMALAVLTVITLSMVTCGPGEPDLDMYTNSDYFFGTNTTVRGTLSGIVKDANSGAPIVGATVTLISYGEVFTTTSSAAGLYSFDNLHLGDYQVYVSANGYASRDLVGTISETAFVQTSEYTSIISEDLTVMMYSKNSSISGQVYYLRNSNAYTVPDGTQIKVTSYNGIDFADSTIGYVATISNGAYILSNLPSVTQVTLKVGVLDVDGDGVGDLATTSWTVGLNEGEMVYDQKSLGNIDDSSFSILFTSTTELEDMDDNGLLSPTADLIIMANEKIDQTLFNYTPGTNSWMATDLYLYYYNLAGTKTYVDLTSAYTFDTTGKMLTIDPGTMQSGERYYFGIDLTSVNGDKDSFVHSFTNSGALTYTLTTPSGTSNFMYLSSSNYNINADGGTADIKWTNTVSGIDGWNIYVQWDADSKWYFDGAVSNKDYYLLDFEHSYSYTINPDPDTDGITNWRVYRDEATQTPLGLGHSIQLALVPFYITNMWLNDAASTNIAVELSKSVAQQMTIEDKMPPQCHAAFVEYLDPIVNGWNNIGGTGPITNQLEVFFTEFVQGTFNNTKVTTFTNDGLGGVGARSIPGISIDFELGDTRTNAIVTIICPNNYYISRLDLNFDAVSDTSGNFYDEDIVPPLNTIDKTHTVNGLTP